MKLYNLSIILIFLVYESTLCSQHKLSMKPVKESVSMIVDLSKIKINVLAESLINKAYNITNPLDLESHSFKDAIFQFQQDNNLCNADLASQVLEHLYVLSPQKVTLSEDVEIDFNLEGGLTKDQDFTQEIQKDKAESILYASGFNRDLINVETKPVIFTNNFNVDSLSILDSVLIRNPSFEEIPRRGGEQFTQSIDGWFDCGLLQFKGESPPDIHPTKNAAWKVNTVAAHGDSYLGMVVRDNESWEALSQKLSKPIEKGACYMMSVLLTQSENYISQSRISFTEINYTTPAVLRVWGAKKYCGRVSLLVESEPISHSEWKEYVFTFQAKNKFKYIVIEAYYTLPTMVPYSGHILLDGMSPIYKMSCE